jgi:hypothetical protein
MDKAQLIAPSNNIEIIKNDSLYPVPLETAKEKLVELRAKESDPSTL